MIALITMGSTVSLRLSQITLLVRTDNDGGGGRGGKRENASNSTSLFHFFSQLLWLKGVHGKLKELKTNNVSIFFNRATATDDGRSE